MAVREIENLWIPMPDGARLAARAWLPQDAETRPVPAVVEYLPYRKRDLMSASDDRIYPWLAARGYACLRVDLRGTGESSGTIADEYTAQEQEDALAMLAWIARQPWCTGRIGMTGISWSGFNALQIAALAPPELAAIVTVASTDDRFRDDVHVMGGWPILADNVAWGASFLLDLCLPPDPALVGAEWRAMWRERCEAVERPPLAEWLAHPHRDAYWRHGSVAEDYDFIGCPVMIVSGFADGYVNAAFRLMAHLGVPRRALIGPWVHAWPDVSAVGPAIGFLKESLRWWDRWLKGARNGVDEEPPLAVFMQESQRASTRPDERRGRWVGLPAWPPPAGLKRQLYTLNDGSLDRRARKQAALRIRSPAATGTAAGDWSPFGTGAELAGDQRADDAGSLRFDSAPLPAALEILGAPRLRLRLAVDRAQAFVAARLTDVHPDGHSALLTAGVLNLAQRKGDDHDEPVVPGETYEVGFDLNHCARRIGKGHRLRLALSTAWWPMLWPAPQAVTSTVTTGASVLELPVATKAAHAKGAPKLAPVEPGAASGQEVVATGLRSRTALSRDLLTDTVSLGNKRGGGIMRNPAIGLTYGVDGDDTLTVEEGEAPAARAVTRRSAFFERGDWRIDVHVTTTLAWADGSFDIEATLDGEENRESVVTRHWKERIDYF